MTAPHVVDPAGALADALTDASPDLMRSLLQTMINALLSAAADLDEHVDQFRTARSAMDSARYGTPSVLPGCRLILPASIHIAEPHRRRRLINCGPRITPRYGGIILRPWRAP